MKVLLMGDESYMISSRMGLKEVCKEKYVSFVEHKEHFGNDRIHQDVGWDSDHGYKINQFPGGYTA
jgi:hypothetical protein